MYLFTGEKFTCCGCKACSSICPTHCISFCEDKESFVYPVRNYDLCVNCNLCESVCPMVNSLSRNRPIDVEVGVHKKQDIIHASSSGGAFSALSEILFSRGYKIYGAMLDENLVCKISDSDTVGGYEPFRKSKYIQADTDNCFARVENDLRSGNKVFFTGVPCYCAALILYLNIKKANTSDIVVVDILCHGVPSQKLFNRYIAELQAKKGCIVRNFYFRNKYKINGSVNSRSVQVDFNDGTTSYLGISQCSFLLDYHSRLFYRPSCYNCPFANTYRVSDLTLADAWGVEREYPSLQSLTGVSLMLANTIKGKVLLETVRENNMQLYDIGLDWAIASNDTLRGATKLHPNRSRFFETYENGFTNSVNRYAIPPFPVRVLKRIVRIIKNFF